jgi:hypothetical protein
LHAVPAGAAGLCTVVIPPIAVCFVAIDTFTGWRVEVEAEVAGITVFAVSD